MGHQSLSVIDLKKKIEQQLDEVEGALEMFHSKKQVYLSDSNTFEF